MKHSIKFRIRELIKQLEIHTGKEYSSSFIAREIGVSRHTTDRIINNEVRSTKHEILAALLDFFHAEGMDITIADLFTVTTDEG